MDYIWLIRDSLSANNAIYFQFTIGVWFFSVKPSEFPQTMKDFSEELILLTPSCMGGTVFCGVDNELQLSLFHFQRCPVPWGSVTSQGWAPGVGTQPAQSHPPP